MWQTVQGYPYFAPWLVSGYVSTIEAIPKKKRQFQVANGPKKIWGWLILDRMNTPYTLENYMLNPESWRWMDGSDELFSF